MRKSLKMMRRRSKKVPILICLIVILVLIRLFLPAILKYEINRILKDHITGYTGHIEDLDLSLHRGAYTIVGFEIAKVHGQEQEPVAEIQTSDIQLYWRQLFHKHILARLKLNHVVVNFIKHPPEKSEASSKEEEWTSVLKKIIPIRIEQLTIDDGEVHYRDFASHPPVNVYINKIHLDASNLTNGNDIEKELVSEARLSGQFKGRGDLHFDIGFNILRDPESFDYNLSAINLDLTAFNDFFQAYGGFQVHRGRFDFFSELASTENKLKGYIKPVFAEVEVLDPNNKLKSLDDGKHELLATVAKWLLKNSKKNQVATEIPIEGTLDKPHFDVWAGIRNALRNAFIQPYEAKLDHSINVQSPKHP